MAEAEDQLEVDGPSALAGVVRQRPGFPALMVSSALTPEPGATLKERAATAYASKSLGPQAIAAEGKRLAGRR